MTDIQTQLPALPPPRDDTDAATAALVAHLAAFAVGVSPRDLIGSNRSSAAARARQVAMYLAHTALSWPLARVGAAFDRDRTTAAHACARVEDWRDDAVIDARLCELEACLGAAPVRRGLSAAGAA